jgi:hypothetical protein
VRILQGESATAHEVHVMLEELLKQRTGRFDRVGPIRVKFDEQITGSLAQSPQARRAVSPLRFVDHPRPERLGDHRRAVR